MKKIYSLLVFLMSFVWTYGQLHPSAAFQISSTTQGFLLPQMTQAQIDNINNPADGLMLICNDCENESGVHVFNAQQNSWVKTATASESFYVQDGKLSDSRTVSLTTQTLSFQSDKGSSTLFLDGAKNRVGMGTSSPSGALEINSTNNGVLIPRISLTASRTYFSLQTPTESILVYNTQTATNTGLEGKGFYYWNGDSNSGSWTKIGSGGENFYTGDGEFTANRTVDMKGKNLVFEKSGKIGMDVVSPLASFHINNAKETDNDIKSLMSSGGSWQKLIWIFQLLKVILDLMNGVLGLLILVLLLLRKIFHLMDLVLMVE